MKGREECQCPAPGPPALAWAPASLRVGLGCPCLGHAAVIPTEDSLIGSGTDQYNAGAAAFKLLQAAAG